MIWELEKLIQSSKEVTFCNPGEKEWYPARPLNYQYRSFWQRIKEAWAVFTGRAEAFVWPRGQ